MAPRLRPAALLLAPLVLRAAAAAAAGPGAADDAVALLQLLAAGAPGLEVGDDVEVEAIEGIPGSSVAGTITGAGTLPGTYNIAVWGAPPEHRFMMDVAPESIQLQKARAQRPPTPPVSLQASEHDLFTALDADRSGAISRSELAKAVARLVGPSAAAAPAPAPAALAPAALAPAAATALAATGTPSQRAAAQPEATAAAPAPRDLPAGKDCWVSGYSRDACCDLYWGPSGDENCWDGFFTFQRCCKPDEQVVQEARRYSEDAAARKAELEEERRAQEEKQKEEKRRKEDAAARQQTEAEQREQQRKAEEEARERYDAEARRRARQEEEQLLREQAQKRTEDQAKAQAEAEAKRSELEQKACPEGFQSLSGDVPGFDQFGREDKLKRKTVELCSRECSKTPACQSFEWSPTKFQCNLNKVAEPKTTVKYADFVFCKRLKKAA